VSAVARAPFEEACAPLLAHLRGRADEMVEWLLALARVESPSLEPASQMPVLDLIAQRLGEIGLRTRLLTGRQHGGKHLYASPPRRLRGAAAQLMLGHCDTVWPLGTIATMPAVREGGSVRGPGVYDMKAGLVQVVFALEALRGLGLEPEVAPVVLVNSDEEIGSRDSRGWIRRLARVADRAFVLEPSLGPGGKLKTARKGVARFTLRVSGRAAHAGLDPGAGASAILELSHQVQQLFALNDPARGVTVNVGRIEGGLRPNVIAPEAHAIIDVRVPGHADAQRVERAIRALSPETEGVSLAVEGGFGRPPMERTPRNRALWRLAERVAGALGLEVDEATAGGGSDGNTTSLYTATLDGLGAVGDGAHAPHEHVLVERMPERTALLAALLLAPPLGDAFRGRASGDTEADVGSAGA
jgi:glutamate carboxypeptidase